MADEQSASTEKYWYNTKTKQVEKGPQSTWEHRMGPYDTEAEARAALDRAASRSAEWDAEDREWNS
jgi:hypothetical protein